MTGKNCFITGAAGGIGTAIASRLSQEGATVVLCDLNEDGLRAMSTELVGNSLYFRGDVTDEESMAEAVNKSLLELGSIDVFFNNAGISPGLTPLSQIDRAIFDRVMGVNVFGVLVGSKVAAQAMRASGMGGKIINTCSIAGKRAAPNGSVYCASKFAIRGITQSLAQELAPDRITVNAFCPGIVDTPLWGDVADDMVKAGVISEATEVLSLFSSNAVLGRASVPEDLAGITSFLASSDSDYMTGQCVNVDGGMTFD